MISASACGKFILLGEHFVLSGVSALAFPLEELKCEVRIKPAAVFKCKALIQGDLLLSEIEKHMQVAVSTACRALSFSIEDYPATIEGENNFPISRGFGSSAAFAVALVHALSQYREQKTAQKLTSQEFLEATFAIEQLFHGTPSGIDTAVISKRTGILFQSGQVVKQFKSFPYDVIAVDSGSRESCSIIVGRLAQRRDSVEFKNFIQEMHLLVNQCEQAILGSGSPQQIANAVNRGHEILGQLELSTSKIEHILDLALSSGAVAGKVTGAGCGGGVIILSSHDKTSQVTKALKDAKLQVLGSYSSR